MYAWCKYYGVFSPLNIAVTALWSVVALLLGHGEKTNDLQHHIYSCVRNNFNVKNFNFIFVTCIWINSTIGTAHMQSRNTNVLCKRLEKPIDFCVKCSLKLSDLKENGNSSTNFSQIIHCVILARFIKRFGICYIYVHTDGQRDFNPYRTNVENRVSS